jgi:hypothetical protein
LLDTSIIEPSPDHTQCYIRPPPVGFAGHGRSCGSFLKRTVEMQSRSRTSTTLKSSPSL